MSPKTHKLPSRQTWIVKSCCRREVMITLFEGTTEEQLAQMREAKARPCKVCQKQMSGGKCEYCDNDSVTQVYDDEIGKEVGCCQYHLERLF